MLSDANFWRADKLLCFEHSGDFQPVWCRAWAGGRNADCLLPHKPASAGPAAVLGVAIDAVDANVLRHIRFG